jgi:Protein of unknown function (DUF1800)
MGSSEPETVDVRQLPRSPIETLRGAFTVRHATRLLWRAGFGPRPGEAQELARIGLDAAVAALTHPTGRPKLIGKPPHADGRPLDPLDVWGDAHCWWLDRMVRSDQQLIERMTLVWHSWFATSIDTSTAAMMLDQNHMLRRDALGNFHTILVNITRDPATLLWLSGFSTKYAPNENYGREMMERFTLGADRGYSQRDVEEQSRALTGFISVGQPGEAGFAIRFDPELHDDGVKTIFGRSGHFGYLDSCLLCVEHPLHPSFMVSTLWDYFVGEPIPTSTLHALERAYVGSGFETRPLLEAILRHPLFYEGPPMVIPPVVYCAGLLRALDETIVTDAWWRIGKSSGQLLFEPPTVAGWDYTRWLDTDRWVGRLTAVNFALLRTMIQLNSPYPIRESPEQALEKALQYWGTPEISPATRDYLVNFGRRVEGLTQRGEEPNGRIQRQNALRMLIATSPDFQTC